MLQLSVIMPTYNRIDHIKSCLLNLVEQFSEVGLDSYEIIIVDSGSTDGTREWVVSQPFSSRIVLVEQDGLQGATKAFRAGISRARGNYLIFRSDHSFSYLPPVIEGMRLLERIPEVGMVFERAYVLGRWMVKDDWIGNGLNSDEIMILRRQDGWQPDECFISYGWGMELAYRIFKSGKLVVGLRAPTFLVYRINPEVDDIHKKFDFDKSDKTSRKSARWTDYACYQKITASDPLSLKRKRFQGGVERLFLKIYSSRVCKKIHRWALELGLVHPPSFTKNLPYEQKDRVAKNIPFGDPGMRLRDWFRARVAPYWVRVDHRLIDPEIFVFPQCLHSDDAVWTAPLRWTGQRVTSTELGSPSFPS